MGFGQSKMTLDLMDVKDWNEIVSMVAAAAKQAKPGEWIIGRGWHQEKWAQRAASRTSKAFRFTTRSARCRRTIR